MEKNRKPFGIYDDSTDFSRALALADAYIGDMGSAVFLYGLTGKPIHLIEGAEGNPCGGLHALRTLSYSDEATAGGTMWVSHNRFNGLFSVGAGEGELSHRGTFLDEETGICLHHFVVSHREKLFFLPERAKNIAEYDRSTGEMAAHSLVCEGSGVQTVAGFAREGDTLWLFPKNPAQPLFRFDMEGGECEAIAAFGDAVRPFLKEGGAPLMPGLVQEGQAVWFPVFGTNVVLRFDWNTETAKPFWVGGAHSAFVAFDFDGTDFWLYDRAAGAIVRWHPTAGVRATYDCPAVAKEAEPIEMVARSGRLFLIPAFGSPIVTIDAATGEAAALSQTGGHRKATKGAPWQRLHRVKAGAQEIRLLPCAADRECVLDGKAMHLTERLPLLLSDETLLQARAPIHRPIYGERFCSLDDFLSLAFREPEEAVRARRTYFSQYAKNVEGTSGQDIYNAVRSRILGK